jgi:hypothetical protein
MSDLNGVWSGSYAYPGSLEPVPFTLELRDNAGLLSGEVNEPAPPYMPPGDVHAMLTGSRSGSRVSFTKNYDSLDHFLDPVRYDGNLDDDECEIAGHWVISPTWSGSFVMTRPKPERASVEAVESVVIDG